MDITNAIRATEPAPEHTPRRPTHADGFNYEWDGTQGVINTGPLHERPRTWDQFILDSGLDPNEVEVVEPVQVRGWDAPVAGGDVVRMHYYRITVKRLGRPALDITELVKAAKRRSSTRPQLTNTDQGPLHTYGDSWAIDAASAVRDALELAGNYDHVTIHAPERDELTLTLNMAGTIVGLAHGHQWRAGQATTWWAKQSHGRQPIGDADLLISAHLHHLRVEHTGSNKTWMQVPALESGSQWWKHRTGEWGQPGVLTLMVGDGGWSSLELL